MEHEMPHAAPPQTLIWDRILPGPGILLSRALIWVLLLLLSSAGLWAAIAEMDVVVQARGRLVVRGEPIKVSVQEPGLVVEVPFQVGDRVNARDVLLRLDSFKYKSEAGQTRKEIATLLVEAGRHRERAQAIRVAMRSTGRELDLARTRAGIVQDQLARVQDLAAHQIAPAVDVQQKSLELNEANARVAAFESTLRRSEDDAAEEERLAMEARARVETLAGRIAQLGGFEERMTLRSPVAGTITQLARLHPGSVLEPDEAAVVLAPDSLPLLAAIQIPNPSMRRLRTGQMVRMRFDAFPYLDFGDLEGTLDRIEPDADPQGSYRAWVRPGRNELRGPRGAAALHAGLMLDAEIIVDRRTVLDFALRPFRRLGEPLRVRE